MSACTHERLHQVSEAVLRTTWERQEDDTYEPDADPKVLDETTGDFTCADCGVAVYFNGETAMIEDSA